jgi:hypothetical protein
MVRFRIIRRRSPLPIGAFPDQASGREGPAMPRRRPDQHPAKWALGPLGERLTLEKLPPPTTRRWIIRRKAEVVCAVRGHLLTREQAIARYNISADEFDAWCHSVERHGLPGLRSTRLQAYREHERRFPDR